MIDFMDRDDQEMVNFQRELLQLAAANQLTVTFHGVAAPTGLERTFPNLLSSEAVRNLEYDKWDEAGVTPEHDVTVPLTRMLAGPLDYHQGTLRGVPLEKFQPRVAAPVVIGTPSRMLASYVVLQNHLPMMADYPSPIAGTAHTRHGRGAHHLGRYAGADCPGGRSSRHRAPQRQRMVDRRDDQSTRQSSEVVAFIPAGRNISGGDLRR